jgi:hypothetical protein
MALVPSVRPVVEIAGRVFTDLSSNLIILGGGNATDNNVTTARKSDATSGYAVTASKTLEIWAGKANVVTTVAGGNLILGYADNDVGQDSATAQTNPKYFGSDPNGYAGKIFHTQSVGQQESNFYFRVPAGKYTNLQQNGGAAISAWRLYGYEVS